jgi:hypothetical protein
MTARASTSRRITEAARLGEISATHVSLATAIWLQTIAPFTPSDTAKLLGSFRVADGYFAADRRIFWGCKVG